MKIMERCEQKEKDTWDLTKIYKIKEHFDKDIEKVKKTTETLTSLKGHLMSSSDTLLKALHLDNEISRRLECLINYAYRKLDEDITNVENQELKGKVDLLISEVASKTAFLAPELLKEEYQTTIEKLLEENQELKEEYELSLKRLFDKKEHILSEKEEHILAELSTCLDSPSKTASILRNAELELGTIKNEKNEEVVLTNENYSIFVKSKDRRVRQDAFFTLYNSYQKLKDTFTETIQGEITKNVRIAQLRGYKSAKSASLLSNRVDEKVYDNLIEAVNEKLDVIYKYFDLKKQVSHLSDFSMYDTYINLADDAKTNYSYEDAKKHVLNVVEIFGEEYKNTVKRAFDERWIDVYPNKGKRGGAYSSGSYDTPPYILLNYQNDYRDVSTLIHELGHSMHSYFSNKNNKYQYSSYKIFVAEVASTVNEMLLNYYMLENSKSNNEKKMILSEMMDDFKATMFRQTMFSEFEHFMHEEVEKGNVLTQEVLCNKYLELNKKYFGNSVIVNDEIRYEWMRIPHFYYDFYVYQYATGLASACDIVRRIRNKEEGAIEGYLKFLSSGDSMDPIEELRLAGVDITKKETITSAIDMFDALIDEFKSLI